MADKLQTKSSQNEAIILNKVYSRKIMGGGFDAGLDGHGIRPGSRWILAILDFSPSP